MSRRQILSSEKRTLINKHRRPTASVAYAGKPIGVSDILEYILSKWLFIFYPGSSYGAGSGYFFGDEAHISPDVDIKSVRTTQA